MGQYDADAKYDKIMATGVLAAGATGPLIIAAPLVDITAMVAVWTRMATEIAALNHVDLDKKTTAKTITAVIAGAGAYVGSAKLVMTVVAKVPGIGMIAGSGVNAVANIAMTLWFGFAMIDLYSRDKKVDDLEDLVTFLVEEINPKKNAKKLGRITAFARRAAKLLRKPKD